MKADTDLPFVSIIVPVFNSARTLPSLLDALMALDYPSARRKIMVVDNGSTDETPAVVRRYPVVLLEERETLTSYGARNCGARQARGELLAFTDGDCVPTPQWIRELVDAIDDPGVGMSVGEVVAHNPDHPIARLTDEMAIMSHRRSLQHKSLSNASTANMLVRREVWEKLGGFKAEMPAFGDMEFCWRMQIELGLRIAYRPAALVYHQHRTDYRSLWRQALRHGWGSAYMHRHFARYYALSGSENAGRIKGLLHAIFIGEPGPDRWHRPRFLLTWYAGLSLGYFASRLGWNPSFRFRTGRGS